MKVVIDAYNGTTTFYVLTLRIQSLRPIVSIFPTLFKNAAVMPPDLRKHVHYPELLPRKYRRQCTASTT